MGFNRAARFSEQIKGIADMEAIAMVRTWSDFGPAADIFKALKSPKGEKMILDGNFFVEELLPRMVLRTLTEEEKATYRAPFKERDDRLPTLILPRDIPIDGEPKDVSAIVDNYGAFLAKSNLPKLLILAEPGAIITGRVRDFVRTWPNQREITVKGRHFIQEDAPREIGFAIADFIVAARHGDSMNVQRALGRSIS